MLVGVDGFEGGLEDGEVGDGLVGGRVADEEVFADDLGVLAGLRWRVVV